MTRWWPEDQDGVRGGVRRVRLIKTDDSGPQQLMDLYGLASERLEKVVRIQNFGFHSNPPVETSEGVILQLGGRSDRAMVAGVEDWKTRPRDRPVGSTAIYDANGQIVSIVDKNIRIVGNDKITIKAKTIVLDAEIMVKLGGEDAVEFVGLCGGGCATKVKAK